MSLCLLLLGTSAQSRELLKFRMVLQSCQGLDSSKIVEILDVELRQAFEIEEMRQDAAAGEGSNFQMSITCGGKHWNIEVWDPITGKALSRRIPRPPLDQERLVAIAASQLLVVSWVELVLKPRGSPSPLSEPTLAVSSARQMAITTLKEVKELTQPDTPVGWLLQFGSGLRLREITDPGGGFDLGIRGGLEKGSIGAIARITFERTVFPTGVGDVLASVYAGGLGVTWEVLRPWPAFRLNLHARTSLGTMQLEGQAESAEMRSGRVRGTYWDGAVALEPELRFGYLVLGLSLEVGVCLATPQGRVAGEGTLDPLGTLLGATLWVGVRGV